MDWNKKIYLSDILRATYGPFKPFMIHLRSKFESFLRGCANAFDIKWKGDHEDKFVDLNTNRYSRTDEDYIREYARESRRLFGRTLMPEKRDLPSLKRPIKPPPPPVPPRKRSKYYRDSMDALNRAEKRMNHGLSDIDRKLEELRRKIERDIDDMF